MDAPNPSVRELVPATAYASLVDNFIDPAGASASGFAVPVH
jgi:hypothetical protein